ncbi:MAG: hypothetical protein ACQEWV_25200 [Bacillota bacterium]
MEKQPSEYLNTLEEEAKKLEKEFEKKRESGGKKKRGKKPKEEKQTIEVKVPATDPDSGFLNRPGKPKGPHYLAHTSLDSKYGIIVDIHPTKGSINDSAPFIERMKVIQDKFNLNFKAAGADKGYDKTVIHHGLKTLNIEGFISPIGYLNGSTSTSHHEFTYDIERDLYICPAKKKLVFAHLKNKGNSWLNKVYSAKALDCKSCPFREQCFGKTGSFRTIERPIAHEL